MYPDAERDVEPLEPSRGQPLPLGNLAAQNAFSPQATGAQLRTLPTQLSFDAADYEEASAEDDAELIGSALGIYDIHALLGAGSMGRVYLARHRALHRPCALKLLSRRRLAESQDFVTRFLEEGRAAASLVHPNIVTVHDIGCIEERYYLEMEFVAGRSLMRLIQDEGRLTPIRSFSIAARIAEGLAAAHRQDIIHRDLKPDNVLVTLQGVPKIADFGLCHRVRGGLTVGLPENLCGTPSYIAPELFQGQPATPRSDVYALGVSLFAMLAGRLPFRADRLSALISQVLTLPTPRVRDFAPDLSLDLAECVGLLLEKSPANRPADAMQAAALLNAVLGQTRDLADLVQEAFQDAPHVAWTRRGDCFQLTVRLDGGRRQMLYVEPSTHAAAERLVLIYSTCCPVQTSYYENALRLNSEMLHGSIGIREVDGVPSFVVSDTYPRGTVDAEEIRRSVYEVARRADAIEHLLTGLDRH